MIKYEMSSIIDFMNKFRLYKQRGEIEKAIFAKVKCYELSVKGIREHERMFDYFLYSVGSGLVFGKENFETLMKFRAYSMYCESALIRLLD